MPFGGAIVPGCFPRNLGSNSVPAMHCLPIRLPVFCMAGTTVFCRAVEPVCYAGSLRSNSRSMLRVPGKFGARDHSENFVILFQLSILASFFFPLAFSFVGSRI